MFLDVLVVGDPDIDRTFGLFKKKKEKVKDKIKKPKYNPCSRRSFLLADEMDDIQDRTFKLFHKKKEKFEGVYHNSLGNVPKMVKKIIQYCMDLCGLP